MNTWQCLTDIELDHIYHGRAGPDEIRHLFACPACRARLEVLTESLSDMVVLEETRVLALAAKGVQTDPVRSLFTADESLVCRIERESAETILITILADRQKWGDLVAIWPVTAPAFIGLIGQAVRLNVSLLPTIPLWQISGAEALWSGDAAHAPAELQGVHGSLMIQHDASEMRLAHAGSVLCLIAARRDGESWRRLELPASFASNGKMSLAFFTALSAVPLT